MSNELTNRDWAKDRAMFDDDMRFYAYLDDLFEAQRQLLSTKQGCSYPFLQMRWYDKQWGKWTEWKEVEGFKLREKYGTTPEEWKASCKMWIEVGGHYEYRIGTRTDVLDWEISYLNTNERD